MKRIMLLILAVTFLLVGCSSSEDKLHGAWKCDVKATVQANDGPEMREMVKNEFAAAFLLGMLENIEFKFDTKKKEMYVRFGKEEKGGTYTVVSEKDNIITLNNGKKNMTFILLDDNTMKTEELGKKDELHTFIFAKVIQ